MAKVICEACGSSFPLERVKELKVCPVCVESLWDEEIENDSNVVVGLNSDESESGLMYFDEIATSYKECPELNGVYAYCRECGKGNSLELDKFKKLVDKEYVILKDNITVTCRGCGKEHKPRKILYKRKDHYAPPASPLPGMQFSHAKKDHHRVKVPCGGNYGCICAPI